MSIDVVSVSTSAIVISPAERGDRSSREEYPLKSSNEEIDITDLSQEAAGSSLDPSSIPLRVVYSPAVSRGPSFRQSSHSPKPSVSLNQESDQYGSTEQILPAGGLSPTSPALEASFLSSGQLIRRRSSTSASATIALAQSSQQTRSLRSSSERISSDRNHEENSVRATFKAFPENKWLQEGVIAKVSLAIVTCCVLGNLIYT